MKQRLILTCVLLLLLQSVERSKVGGDGTPEECKAIGAVLLKQQLKMINDCAAQLKFKDSKERKAKGSCVLKCVMEKTGIIDKSGHVDKEHSIKFLKANLGPFWERLEVLMTPCEDFMHDLDPKEEFCKSYDPMIKCGTTAFTSLCK